MAMGALQSGTRQACFELSGGIGRFLIEVFSSKSFSEQLREKKRDEGPLMKGRAVIRMEDRQVRGSEIRYTNWPSVARVTVGIDYEDNFKPLSSIKQQEAMFK